MHRTVLTATVILSLTACAHLATDKAYVIPQRGQSAARLADDKADCFRVAQNLPEAAHAGGPGTPGFMDTGTLVGVEHGTAGTSGIVGGAALDIGFGAAAKELELARRYPPDTQRYEACLVGRGYEVTWP